MSLLELFCAVDDFCIWLRTQALDKQLGGRKRGPQASLSLSEIMTILIHFHQSHYRDFKAYYTKYVLKQLRSEFPGLVSYTRFVELTPTALLPLRYYLASRFGRTSGIAFIDSTPLSRAHRRAWLLSDGSRSLPAAYGVGRFQLPCHAWLVPIGFLSLSCPCPVCLVVVCVNPYSTIQTGLSNNFIPFDYVNL